MKVVARSIAILLGMAMLLINAAGCGDDKPKSGGDSTATEVAETMAPQYVRKNAASPEAKADLDAMAVAMKKMKELGCTDFTSWYYQGGIHWVPSSFGDNGDEKNLLCAEYQGGTPDPAKFPNWNNCTHFEVSAYHFAIWHRIYIYYLESIIRKYSGKADFALPYWNYATYNGVPFDTVMPGAFWQDSSSSLFEAGRWKNLNQGKGNQQNFTMKMNLLSRMNTYKAFNASFDASPHGAMHNCIGGAIPQNTEPIYNRISQTTNQLGLMADVPTAAFDPIFWVHHAEIDFIWAQWMRTPNGRIPTPAEMNANQPINYKFIDEKGDLVTLTIEQAWTMAFMTIPSQVTYDQFVSSEQFAETAPEEHQYNAVPLKKTALLQKIKGATNNFALALPLETDDMTSLTNRSDDSRVVLDVVVSFSGNTDPNGIYNVFLQHKSDSSPADEESDFVGDMTFFGASFHKLAHGAHDHGGDTEKTFRFDLTNLIDFSKFDGNFTVVVKKNNPKSMDIKVVSFELIRLDKK